MILEVHLEGCLNYEIKRIKFMDYVWEFAAMHVETF